MTTIFFFFDFFFKLNYLINKFEYKKRFLVVFIKQIEDEN